MRKLDLDGKNIGVLMDKIATVNGIVVNGIKFDASNKTILEQMARKNAYADARDKALDYSESAKVFMTKIVKITDQQVSVRPPIAFNTAKIATFSIADSSPTQLSIGDISVDYSLTILYSFM